MKTLLTLILLLITLTCDSQVLLGKSLSDIYHVKGSSYNTHYFKTSQGKDTDSSYVFILNVYKGSEFFYMRNGVCYRQEYFSSLGRLKMWQTRLDLECTKTGENKWLGDKFTVLLLIYPDKFKIIYKPL